MDIKRTIIRSISSVLEKWAILDEVHRDQSYDDAVQRLKAWKNDLEGEMQ